MDVQNISGTDLISQGFNVNSRVSNENVKTEKEEIPEDIKNREMNKGTQIDTKA